MPDQITDEREDMKLKLSLEAGLGLALISLFHQIARDYRAVYSAVGQIINTEIYKAELIGALRPTYRKAGRKAGKELRTGAEIIYPENNRSVVNNAIDVNLLNFVDEEPVVRAEIINRTTKRQLNEATLATIIGAALFGEFLSNEEIAKESAQRFVNRSKGRSENIAVTEALNAVEGARLIEANTLLENEVEVKPKKKDAQSLRGSLYRKWWSREDFLVRLTHVIAHGQTVLGTMTPFQVGNSLLMYPGDTSLGADMEEIYGCRCFAATFIG